MKPIRIVAVALAALIAIGAIAGCGTPPPDKAVTGFLDDFKTLNVAEAQKHLVTAGPFTEPAAEEKALLQAIMNKVSYKVTGSEVKGSTATVALEITSADLVKIVSDSLADILPAAMAAAFSGGGEADVQTLMEQAMMNGINDAKAPLTTSQISVSLQKSGSEWKLAMTDEESSALFNAITGNLMTAITDAMDAGTN